MRYSAFLLLFLIGCRSPQKLIQIAVKRDPGIIICTPDTIIRETETASVIGYDSIKIDNSRIKISVFGQGKLNLFYELKPDTAVYVPETVITPKSTVKQRERTKRKEIKRDIKNTAQEQKTKRVEYVQERKKVKTWLFEFISTLVLLISLVAFLIWRRIKK